MRVHSEPGNGAVMGSNKWPILVVVISQCIVSPGFCTVMKHYFLLSGENINYMKCSEKFYTQEWGSDYARQLVITNFNLKLQIYYTFIFITHREECPGKR